MGGLEVVEFVKKAPVLGSGCHFASLEKVEPCENLGDNVFDMRAPDFRRRPTDSATAAITVIYVLEYLATMIGIPASGRIRLVSFQVPALNPVHNSGDLHHRRPDLAATLSLRARSPGAPGPFYNRGWTDLTPVLCL